MTVYYPIVHYQLSIVDHSISASDQELDSAIVALENVQSNVIHLEPIVRVNAHYRSINKSIDDMIEQLRAVQEEREMIVRHRAKGRGRPGLSISMEQLHNLLELQFTQVEISRLIGCSPRTIRRRMEEYGFEGLAI